MPRIVPELESNVGVARRAAGMTQNELARRVEVSRQTIGAIEKGEYNPSTVLALRLALVLGTTVECLFALPAAERARISASVLVAEPVR